MLTLLLNEFLIAFWKGMGQTVPLYTDACHFPDYVLLSYPISTCDVSIQKVLTLVQHVYTA